MSLKNSLFFADLLLQIAGKHPVDNKWHQGRSVAVSDDADSDVALSYMVGGVGQNACTYHFLLLWQYGIYETFMIFFNTFVVAY